MLLDLLYHHHRAPARPGGGGISAYDWNQEVGRQRQKQIQAEDEIVITVVAQMIAQGALG
jgi:hypothetical protein